MDSIVQLVQENKEVAAGKVVGFHVNDFPFLYVKTRQVNMKL